MDIKNEGLEAVATPDPQTQQFFNDAKFLLFQEKIGYTFNDPLLLLAALTHKSFPLPQNTGPNATSTDNERLEFLGDAVLSLVSAHLLYSLAPKKKEGELSRLRACFVCQEHLAKKAQELSLGSYIRAEKAMRVSGGVQSVAVLADTMEAVIGAVFLDGGLLWAQKTIEQLLGPLPMVSHPIIKDEKSVLQELLQASCSVTPVYRIVGMTGPLHAPQFQVEVSANGKTLALGEGTNKRIATRISAKKALEELGQLEAEQIREKIVECQALQKI